MTLKVILTQKSQICTESFVHDKWGLNNPFRKYFRPSLFARIELIRVRTLLSLDEFVLIKLHHSLNFARDGVTSLVMRVVGTLRAKFKF